MRKFFTCSQVLDGTIVTFVLLVILISPLAIGSVSLSSRSILFICAMFLLLLWAGKCCCERQIRLWRTYLWLPLLLFLLLILLQMSHMPAAVLDFLSPYTGKIYRELGYSPPSPTLSIYPHVTYHALMRLLILLTVFFVILHSFRKEWQIRSTVFALLALGTFQVIYGSFEQFSTTPHILWLPRYVQEAVATGTFHNRNHFGGLLSMLGMVSVGFFVALLYRQQQLQLPGNLWARIFTKHAVGLVVAGVVAILLFVGILLSLSRGALVCFCLAMLGFTLVIGISHKMRWHLVPIMLILGLTLAAGVYLGMEQVISGMQSAASGHDPSWHARIAFAVAAFPMTIQFPLAGTGWGTFRFISRMYQPEFVGDPYVDYLHNDWLQVVCECGWLGAILLYWCLFGMLGKTAWCLYLHRESYYRWLGMGALGGVFAMLCHSLGDFNLLKITSNGIVFAVLAAIAIVCAYKNPNSPTSDAFLEWKFPLQHWYVRMAFLLLTMTAAVCLSVPVVKAGVADIYFNRYCQYHGKGDLYFWLPLSAANKEEAKKNLENAWRWDTYSARYAYEMSYSLWKDMDEQTLDQAKADARKIDASLEERSPDKFTALASRLALFLQQKEAGRREKILERALGLIDQAVAKAPTIPHQQLHKGILLASLLELYRLQQKDTASLEKKFYQTIDKAILCAPNQPLQLFTAGSIMAQHLAATVRSEPEKKLPDAILKKIEHCFSRTLYIDANYSEKTYATLAATLPHQDLIAKVTPNFARNYQQLYNYYWKRQKYESCKRTLQQLELLPYSPFGDQNPLTPEGQKLLHYQRLGTILDVAGDYAERQNVQEQYLEAQRKESQAKLQQARQLVQDGHLLKAFYLYNTILEQDWGYAEALMDAAELAMLPQFEAYLSTFSFPLDYLCEVALHNPSLDGQQCQRFCNLAQQAVMEDDDPVVIFLKGAVQILAGKNNDGFLLLQKLEKQRSLSNWRQQHLLWVHLAKAYKQMQEKTKEAEAWHKVLQLVPTHKEALYYMYVSANSVRKNTADSDPKALPSSRSSPERKQSLAPYPKPEDFFSQKSLVKVDITFGGKVRCLGYYRNPDRSLTLFWEFLSKMKSDSRLVIDVLDSYQYVLEQHLPVFQQANQPYPLNFPRHGEMLCCNIALPEDAEEKETFLLRVAWYTKDKRLVTDMGNMEAIITVK